MEISQEKWVAKWCVLDSRWSQESQEGEEDWGRSPFSHFFLDRPSKLTYFRNIPVQMQSLMWVYPLAEGGTHEHPPQDVPRGPLTETTPLIRTLSGH